MAEGLSAFLVSSAEAPWAWGRVDCTMWAADWCVVRWGVDPAAAYRDRYATEAEADQLTAGGLVALVEPLILTFAQRVQVPADGDIGVVMVEGRETAAIRVDGRWAFRTPAGIGFADVPAVAIWGD